jgi:hypothetical protein
MYRKIQFDVILARTVLSYEYCLTGNVCIAAFSPYMLIFHCLNIFGTHGKLQLRGILYEMDTRWRKRRH